MREARISSLKRFTFRIAFLRAVESATVMFSDGVGLGVGECVSPNDRKAIERPHKRLLDRLNREAGLKALDRRIFESYGPPDADVSYPTGGHEVFNRSHADLENPCDFLLREQAGMCGVCFFHAGCGLPGNLAHLWGLNHSQKVSGNGKVCPSFNT